jgi:hypothetical protein
MEVVNNYLGKPIRITSERMAHIKEHPEMAEMAGAIQVTLQAPEKVVQSQSDGKANLYYRSYPNTPVGEKYLCVVVKEGLTDSFLLTAYLTDRIKKGEILWNRK